MKVTTLLTLFISFFKLDMLLVFISSALHNHVSGESYFVYLDQDKKN